MKVCIVGNDLRTIALARALQKENHRVFAVPGVNSLSVPHLLCLPLPTIDEHPWQQVCRRDEILKTIRQLQPDMVVCLHVESSDSGIVEALIALAQQKACGFDVFGVGREASKLETSKLYGLSIAKRSGMRVPHSFVLRAEEKTDWLAAIQRSPFPLVLKANGLAGGRGTTIVRQASELPNALASLPPGDAIVQEYVAGHEVALSLVCVSRQIAIWNVNFEYKRYFDGDVGPNTPGLGTIARGGFNLSPFSSWLANLSDELQLLDYCGPLDVSFMIDAQHGYPVFLEFTSRFGDPELSAELLLLNSVTPLLRQVSSRQTVWIDHSELPWAMGIVARGGSHCFRTGSGRNTPHSIVHDLMSGPNGDESCFSMAGKSVEEIRAALYARLAADIPLESHFRTDIACDLVTRWITAISSSRSIAPIQE
jgi:phosphoribosylamine---glycine ligase